MIDWILSLGWYVWLTPLFLAPIFLLFVFVGCQQILGIEEGVAAPPETPAPNLTFTYGANLATGQGLVRLVWVFEETLDGYPPGGGLPATFSPGPFFRGEGLPEGIQPTGELIDHGSIGEPTTGEITCRCRGFRQGDVDPSLTAGPVSKSPGDADFPEFILASDFTLS